MDYEDALSAKNPDWKSEARKLIVKGVSFVAVDVAPDQFKDCQALAQEFDYVAFHEDKEVAHQYPAVLPRKVGFAHRDLSKRRKAG